MGTLTKELKKISENKIKAIQEDLIVKEANQLLLENHTEDEQILERIGLDHHLRESKKKLGYSMMVEKLSKQFNTDKVFSGEDIQKICFKYNLRLIQAKYYNGNIPADLARSLRNFVNSTDDKSVIISQNKLFILAPISQFNSERIQVRPVDPILFYRISDKSDYDANVDTASLSDTFIAVKEWGNDFTIFRRLSKYFSSSKCSTAQKIRVIDTNYLSVREGAMSNSFKMIAVFSIISLLTLLNFFASEYYYKRGLDMDTEFVGPFLSFVSVVLFIYLVLTVTDGVKNLKNTWNANVY